MNATRWLGIGIALGGLGLSACYIEGGVYTCFDDWDCPGGSYCGDDGVCYSPVVVTPGCYDDYDCAPGYYCGGDGACYVDSAPGCRSSYDCAAGYYCGGDGYCYQEPRCQDDRDCNAGDYCETDGFCYALPSCVDHSQCPAGTYCAVDGFWRNYAFLATSNFVRQVRQVQRVNLPHTYSDTRPFIELAK